MSITLCVCVCVCVCVHGCVHGCVCVGMHVDMHVCVLEKWGCWVKEKKKREKKNVIGSLVKHVSYNSSLCKQNFTSSTLLLASGNGISRAFVPPVAVLCQALHYGESDHWGVHKHNLALYGWGQAACWQAAGPCKADKCHATQSGSADEERSRERRLPRNNMNLYSHLSLKTALCPLLPTFSPLLFISFVALTKTFVYF